MAASPTKPATPMPPPAAQPPSPTFSGASKAALWLLSADEESAVGALSHLTNDELMRVRKAAESMPKVDPEQLASVHKEFKQVADSAPLRLRGNVEYFGHLAVQALGEAKANAVLYARRGLPPAKALMEADIAVLASLLVEEHPQVVAAVLSTLPPKRASELLLRMTPELVRDVIGRLARLNKVSQTALQRAQQIISAGLPVEEGQDVAVDGVRMAATVLNSLAGPESDQILKDLAESAGTLANEVRQAMFTFADLARLDKRSMQTLMKDVPNDRLLLSLKAADDDLRAKIFSTFSKRAAEMMQEELSLLPPARLADVEAAQAEIAAIAIKLRDEGKITIVSGEGDFV